MPINLRFMFIVVAYEQHQLREEIEGYTWERHDIDMSTTLVFQLFPSE